MYLYVEKDGFLQDLHPNTKTISVLGLFLAALFAGGGAKNALRISPLLVILFTVSIYIWTFMYYNPEGDYTWISVGGYFLPRETIMLGLGMGVRISAMLLMGLAFLSVTRVEDFTAGRHRIGFSYGPGMKRYGLPFGMCFGLSLSFRLLPLFVGTAVTISEAQRSRGLDLESGGYLGRARKYVPLFVSSIRNADGLALTLESKGFGRTNPRTYLRDYKLGVMDGVAMLLVLALIVGMWWLNRHGYGAI